MRLSKALRWFLLGSFACCLPFAAGGAMAEPPCKYKRDGTGNCLSPAFYKCQRDWKRCNDRCRTSRNPDKCHERCEIRYAPHCGD